jgi:hypothetical protein
MELELIIAAVAIVLLLIIILIIYTARKKISTKVHKSPEPSAMQAKENKPANKPILKPEPKKESLPESQANEPLRSAELNNEPIVEPQTNETVTLSQKDSYENLPQDSMLRRHYLTNLRAMIESLNPPHPTDSSLSRHYDSIITAEIERCLNDQGAIERLICNYEDHKKTLAQQFHQPKTIAEPLLKAGICHEDSVSQHEIPKLPEDSMLRRHAITHLYAMVESNMPIRPTDSVLRRHYDTMINTEVNKLLDCKVV